MKNRFVVLVHGYSKHQDDMGYLRDQLMARGYDTLTADLPTTYGSMDDAVTALYEQIKHERLSARTLSFVAHSMGGLIVRRLVHEFHLTNLGNAVFIGTPHGGSRIADVASNIPGYALIYPSIHSLRTDITYPLFHNDRNFKLGVIAGNRRTGILGTLLLSSSSDGRVEMSAAHCADEDDFVVVPFGHHEMHHQPLTARLVDRFIQYGDFNLTSA